MKVLRTLRAWLARFDPNKPARMLSTAIICVSLAGMGWLANAYPEQVYGAPPAGIPVQQIAATATGPALHPQPVTVADLSGGLLAMGIQRLAQLHTIRPDHSRFEVTQYTIQPGDTVFGIAEKFGLKPSTILWGNLELLGDNPEMLVPGQVLNILPVDGVYYQWHEKDGLNRVSEVFGVKPEDIIDFPGNHLEAQAIGDFSNPNISVGTWLIVPGGHRNFISWSAPQISRFNPGVAHLYGPGACDKPTDGVVGRGTFTWPTVEHWLSGYDYTPEANHPALDFAGSMGNAIYAADNGVIVYAGWNDWGYGNVTVIDHGNGYQSLYAHQSQIRVTCGQSVIKGDLIGNMGSTGRSSGPHLHFEMWYNGAHINPHQFLPSP